MKNILENRIAVKLIFIGEYIPIFNKEGLTLKKSIPNEEIIVNIDIEKIARVFENLFMNVLKYSFKPSEVNVSLHQVGKNIRVSIKNRVDKIEIDNVEKLFERFYKVDSSRSSNNSSGLGLAIARKIVDLHGGRIWAEYNDSNITFNVEL